MVLFGSPLLTVAGIPFLSSCGLPHNLDRMEVGDPAFDSDLWMHSRTEAFAVGVFSA